MRTAKLVIVTTSYNPIRYHGGKYRATILVRLVDGQAAPAHIEDTMSFDTAWDLVGGWSRLSDWVFGLAMQYEWKIPADTPFVVDRPSVTPF